MSEPGKVITMSAQTSALRGLLRQASPYSLKKAGIVGREAEGQLLIDRLSAALRTLEGVERGSVEGL